MLTRSEETKTAILQIRFHDENINIFSKFDKNKLCYMTLKKNMFPKMSYLCLTNTMAIKKYCILKYKRQEI